MQRMRRMGRTAAAILLTALLLAACGTVEVGALRDAQDDFSGLAARENEVTGFAILGGEWENRPGRSERMLSAYSRAEAENFHRGYAELHRRLVELEAGAAGTFRADGLLGVAATLRVLAYWRATFFDHLTRTYPEAPTDAERAVEGTPSDLPVSPAALSDVVAEARKVKAAGYRVFPRDAFLLEAMAPLVRYDIAYITALEYTRQGRLAGLDAANLPHARYIAEQMALAEEELTGIYRNDSKLDPRLGTYVALARLSMLVAARGVAFRGGVRLDGPDASREFPKLAARIAQFHADRAADPSWLARALDMAIPKFDPAEALPELGGE